MKPLRLFGLMMALFSAFTLSSCKKDPCKNVSCQNGGICQDGNCRCNLPWEGSKCEVDARDKFKGIWIGTQKCENGNGSQDASFIITKSGPYPTRIEINSSTFIYAELTSSNTFDIPSQTVNIGGLPGKLIGNGSLSGNQINMRLVLVQAGDSTTCTITANKQ